MGVTSKMTRMVPLYTLILSMVSLSTSLPKNHRKIIRVTYPPDGSWGNTPFDYSESKGPKKNYKKIFTKITDERKRQWRIHGLPQRSRGGCRTCLEGCRTCPPERNERCNGKYYGFTQDQVCQGFCYDETAGNPSPSPPSGGG